MMRYVILAAGEFPKRGETLDILTGGDILICCDGAVEDALRYRMPDFIVGDMDSISPQNKERFREIIHSESEQEYNDLTKAVRFTLRHAQGVTGPFSITILGATGKREDHTLGNISLLMMYAEMLPEGATIEMVSDRGRFVPIDGDGSILVGRGREISIFATDPTLKLTTFGVEYPTDEVIFDQWSWWKATLNVATEDTVTFKMNHPARILVYVGGMR